MSAPLTVGRRWSGGEVSRAWDERALGVCAEDEEEEDEPDRRREDEEYEEEASAAAEEDDARD